MTNIEKCSEQDMLNIYTTRQRKNIAMADGFSPALIQIKQGTI